MVCPKRKGVKDTHFATIARGGMLKGSGVRQRET